jgi:hypothetical protein
MNLAYTSEDCNIFAEALEHAWEMYLKTGRLTKDNLDVAEAALSYAILQAAARGERNARRLAIIGVAHVDIIEPRIRRERSWSRVDDSERINIRERSSA